MLKLGTPSIALDEFFRKCPEGLILNHYFGVVQVPCFIHSPLRKDNHASFGIYVLKGRIFWKDIVTLESGGILDLMIRYTNKGMEDCMSFILKDLNTKENVLLFRQTKNYNPIKNKIHKSLNVRIRPWTTEDIEYWNSYGISYSNLVKSRTFPIDRIVIDKFTVASDKLAYVYIEKKDNRITKKIYQPFNTNGHKWYNEHDSSVWDLWTLLPERGTDVIITSSRKDALNLITQTGIPSICLQAESYMPKPQVIDILKSRFDNIYVFFDNDFKGISNWGKNFSDTLCSKYKLTQLLIPDKYQAKDPSDLYKSVGKAEYIKIINNLIKK